jgi:hypothetical protein
LFEEVHHDGDIPDELFLRGCRIGVEFESDTITLDGT